MTEYWTSLRPGPVGGFVMHIMSDKGLDEAITGAHVTEERARICAGQNLRAFEDYGHHTVNPKVQAALMECSRHRPLNEPDPPKDSFITPRKTFGPFRRMT